MPPKGLTSQVPGFRDVTPEEERAAVRVVAAHATDATDCVRLLDILGVDPAQGRRVPDGDDAL
jgi:hypothetical protein